MYRVILYSCVGCSDRVYNKVTTELRRAKRKFEEKLAEGIKKDSKSFFRYVKSKVGTREKNGPLKDDSGNVLTEAGAWVSC